MKTLIFCTSYFDTEEIYQKRYQKWIDYYNNHPFTNNKHMYLIDDSSDLELMTDDAVHIIKEDQLEDYEDVNKINIYSFNNRKGLNWTHCSANNEGWWRSFSASLAIAKKYNYEKIIHIESDAFLISKEVINHIDSLDEGWTTFFCPRWNMPEAAIQIICKDQFENFSNFISSGYQELSKTMAAERDLPFTDVEKRFIGDRYGEDEIKQMEGQDYYCQTNLDTIITPKK